LLLLLFLSFTVWFHARKKSRLVFGEWLAILIEIIRGFPQSFQTHAGMVPQLVQTSFHPNPFQFISNPIIQRCIVSMLEALLINVREKNDKKNHLLIRHVSRKLMSVWHEAISAFIPITRGGLRFCGVQHQCLMRGPRTMNNVVGCGSVLDALLFNSTTENEVVGFFNLPNFSSRTMTLGFTQPLTEMSNRNRPGG
jgi:hypothetical protein